MWTAMVLAMGPPLLLRELRRVWRGSLRRSRALAIGWFCGGYVAVWLLVGALVALASEWLFASSGVTVAAVVAVTLWHCSPARQRCLTACHRSPALRVFGAAARWDALRYGVATGAYCGATCGPLMVLTLLANDYHLLAMSTAAVLVTIERYQPPKPPRWQWPVWRGRALEWHAMPSVAASSPPGVG
jgi:predicted metal-binding membrane protein